MWDYQKFKRNKMYDQILTGVQKILLNGRMMYNFALTLIILYIQKECNESRVFSPYTQFQSMNKVLVLHIYIIEIEDIYLHHGVEVKFLEFHLQTNNAEIKPKENKSSVDDCWSP